jgi:lipid A 3-O-deacylase
MNAYTKVAALSTIIVAPTPSVTSAAEVPRQPPSPATNSITIPELSAPKSTIWQDGIGNGFSSSAQSVTLEAGVALGMSKLGSHQAHDLALTSLSYGHMLGPVLGEGHWYRGNFEVRAELFGGGQYSPSKEWLVGLTPHLRYNFATGTRWIPFVDGGVGVTATGIGPPDLSGTFEFNLQPGMGLHWFLRDNLALTSELKYYHFSCAGISNPNSGMNNIGGMIGLTWFFGK